MPHSSPVHPNEIYSAVVIGGGVVGCATLRALTMPTPSVPMTPPSESAPAPSASDNLGPVPGGLGLQKVLLLEKNAQVLTGASAGNSGIFHTGFDAPVGTLEHACMRSGYSQILALAETFGQSHAGDERGKFPFKTGGAMVVAKTAEEWEAIQTKILPKAHENGVPVRLLSPTEVQQMDPYLLPTDSKDSTSSSTSASPSNSTSAVKCYGGLYVESEATTDPFVMPLFLLHQALHRGAELQCGACLIGGRFHPDKQLWELKVQLRLPTTSTSSPSSASSSSRSTGFSVNSSGSIGASPSSFASVCHSVAGRCHYVPPDRVGISPFTLQSELALAAAGSVTVWTRCVINSAGNYGDLVDQMLLGPNWKAISALNPSPSSSSSSATLATDEYKTPFHILPRKGQFVVFNCRDKLLPTSSTYSSVLERVATVLPVPTERTKGVLLSRTVFGLVIVGPTAEDQTERETAEVDGEVLAQLHQKALELFPVLRNYPVLGCYAGLRPAAIQGDKSEWQVRTEKGGAYLCLGGIRSTGLTSALGLGSFAVASLRRNFPDLESSELPNFFPDYIRNLPKKVQLMGQGSDHVQSHHSYNEHSQHDILPMHNNNGKMHHSHSHHHHHSYQLQQKQQEQIHFLQQKAEDVEWLKADAEFMNFVWEQKRLEEEEAIERDWLEFPTWNEIQRQCQSSCNSQSSSSSSTLSATLAATLASPLYSLKKKADSSSSSSSGSGNGRGVIQVGKVQHEVTHWLNRLAWTGQGMPIPPEIQPFTLKSKL